MTASNTVVSSEPDASGEAMQRPADGDLRDAAIALLRWYELSHKMAGWVGTPEECKEFDVLADHVWGGLRRAVRADGGRAK